LIHELVTGGGKVSFPPGGVKNAGDGGDHDAQKKRRSELDNAAELAVAKLLHADENHGQGDDHDQIAEDEAAVAVTRAENEAQDHRSDDDASRDRAIDESNPAHESSSQKLRRRISLKSDPRSIAQKGDIKGLARFSGKTQGMSARSRAFRTACVRLRTSSFSYSLDICVFTVFGETLSRRAISLLAHPDAS